MSVVVLMNLMDEYIPHRKSRKTVDTTETMKLFGPIEIHYGKVQQKVNLKYDSWHREILSRFGSLLGENMQDFHGTVAKVSCCLMLVELRVHAMCDVFESKD